ncbi:hypothetical protein [Desulfonatronovibrio hydrogenovorans]|uniref:hypothetical protein n=1 Tax=Desulfonatronovibrio hydrogenovorans TaxID=53245 RepID=UPI00048C761E|nr:hypothetical protein [Desulfonatronovibrio hydrogenovorans]
MGEMIQVRVSAGIFDQDKALKKWSAAAKLAFGPDWDRDFSGRNLLTELVDALYDKHRLGMLPKNMADILADDIAQAHQLHHKLQHYLAERAPQDADRITYDLEEVLDRIQEKAD